MDDDLQAKVTAALGQTSEGFDHAFPGATDRFVAAIVPAFANLRSTLKRFSEEPLRGRLTAGEGSRYTLPWQMLWDSCNALLGAFTLFQRGYATETLAIIRAVLERVAGALVLFDNPLLLPRFKYGALKDLGTVAIGPASRVISDLGRMYGLLSELGTHIGKDNVGTGVIAIERGESIGQLHLAIGGNIPTTGPDVEGWRDMVLEFSEIAERILAPAPEQLFFNPSRQTATLKTAGEGGPTEVM